MRCDLNSRSLILGVFTIIVTLSGVCSVSESYGYPASKASSWSENSDDHSYEQTPPTKNNRSQKETGQSRASTPVQKTPLSPGTHNLSLGIGEVFLTGGLSSKFDNAIGTQLQYTYGVSDLFSFESNLGFSSHSNSNNNLNMVQLLTGLRTNLIYFDQLVPFFSGGLGFYHPSLSYNNGQSANAILFGLNLGFGADLLLSDRIYFGTRLTMHDMFSSTTTASDGTSVSIGGTYLSFMVHAGFSF